MPSRVIAFFLSLLLLWSGLTTMEVSVRDTRSASEQPHATANAGQQAAHEGSVDDHHLDDVPVQSLSDQPPEPQIVFPELVPARLLGGRMDPPEAPAAVAFASPFLGGPLRPPCCTAHAG